MDPRSRLYLDYNATSPLSVSVQELLKSGDLLFANPSSQHSLGKASRKTINDVRQRIFNCFGKKESETKLFFHSGATEAFQTFAYSFSEWSRISNKQLLLVTSVIDHPAVTSIKERFYGTHVDCFDLNLNPDLTYDHAKNFNALKALKDKNPDLIILYHHLWVHNETGVVSSLEELEVFKKIPDLYIHVDAVQAPGKILEWKSLSQGDIFSFSAHKFGALKGVGFSFLGKSIPFVPFMTGGGQQHGLRSGTENALGILTIGLALEDLKKVNISQTYQYREYLEKYLNEKLSGIGGIIPDKALPKNSNTIYFYLKHVASDIALALFDIHGVEISAGSACSSGAARPSIILTQLGFKEVASHGLRISLPFTFNEEDFNKVQKALEPIFNKLHKNSAKI